VTRRMTDVQRLVVRGGPGDGLVVAEAILQSQMAGRSVVLTGFLNDVLPVGALLHGVPVLGRFEDWKHLDENLRFVPAVQKIKDMPARVRRIESLNIPDHRWAIVVHPKAAVSSDARIGAGAFIASCATVQPECQIGRFASLRAGAMLGHHCHVEDHTPQPAAVRRPSGTWRGSVGFEGHGPLLVGRHRRCCHQERARARHSIRQPGQAGGQD
jgi:hypothetical protein